MPYLRVGQLPQTPGGGVLYPERIISGYIEAAEIVLGGGGILRSYDFESGVSGWRIDGEGNAEFNNVEVRGELRSEWDPVGPKVFRAGVTVDGTPGLDTDHHGIVFADGTWNNTWVVRGPGVANPGTWYFRVGTATSYLKVDTALSPAVTMSGVDVAGNITLITGGSFRTAASGRRVEMSASTTNEVRFYSSGGFIGAMGYEALGHAGDLVLGTTSANDLMLRSAAAIRFFIAGTPGPAVSIGSTAVSVENGYQLLLADNSSVNPGLAFVADPDTGIDRDTTNGFALITGGVIQVQVRTNGLFLSNTLWLQNRSLNLATDANHFIKYGAVPNGPEIAGWTGFWLHSGGGGDISEFADSDEVKTMTENLGGWRNHVAADHVNISDPRFKANRRLAGSGWLEKALQVPVELFQGRPDPDQAPEGPERIGPTADRVPPEVQRRTTRRVGETWEEEEVLAISSAAMDGLLLAALQELAARVMALEAIR